MLLCPKCGNKLEVETEIEQYPFVCKVCDENFFEFEGEKMNDVINKQDVVEDVVDYFIATCKTADRDAIIKEVYESLAEDIADIRHQVEEKLGV